MNVVVSLREQSDACKKSGEFLLEQRMEKEYQDPAQGLRSIIITNKVL